LTFKNIFNLLYSFKLVHAQILLRTDHEGPEELYSFYTLGARWRWVVNTTYT